MGLKTILPTLLIKINKEVLMKKYIILILMAFCISVMGAPAFASDIQIFINDELKSVDPKPFIQDGRTYVPIRFVAENFGASVDWDTEQQKVTISQPGKIINLYINSTQATVNEGTIQIDAVPMIMEGRTVVPLRFVVENLGLNVKWDEPTKSIFLSANKVINVPMEGVGTFNPNDVVVAEGVDFEYIPPDSYIQKILNDGSSLYINLLDTWEYEEGYSYSTETEVICILRHKSGATFNLATEKLYTPISKEFYITKSEASIMKAFVPPEIFKEDNGDIYNLGYAVQDTIIAQTLEFPYITDNTIEKQVNIYTFVLPDSLSDEQANNIIDEAFDMIFIQ